MVNNRPARSGQCEDQRRAQIARLNPIPVLSLPLPGGGVRARCRKYPSWERGRLARIHFKRRAGRRFAHDCKRHRPARRATCAILVLLLRGFAASCESFFSALVSTNCDSGFQPALLWIEAESAGRMPALPGRRWKRHRDRTTSRRMTESFRRHLPLHRPPPRIRLKLLA